MVLKNFIISTKINQKMKNNDLLSELQGYLGIFFFAQTLLFRFKTYLCLKTKNKIT